MRRLSRWYLAPLVALQVLVATAPARAQDSKEEQIPPVAVVVELAGDLTSAHLALIQRGMREVRRLGARHLILEISSQGGEGAADLAREAQAVLADLKSDEISTVAYVEEFAFSSAALIALSCNQIVLHEKASIGGAQQPDAFNVVTGEMEPVADELLVLKAQMRAAVEGTDRGTEQVLLLVAAMADPRLHLWEVTFKDDSTLEQTTIVEQKRLEEMRKDPKIQFVVDPVEFKTRPLALDARNAVLLGVVDDMKDSFEAMIKDYLILDPRAVLRLEPSWSEDFVTWLHDMNEVLMVLGFILLLIEFKTPGFALPGILGVIMFGLAFFGSYMAGLAEISEILLFFVGLGLLATEIFFFPGTILFAMAGFLCIVAGLILSQQSFVIPANDVQSDIMLHNFLNFGLIMLFVMLGTWAVYANIHRIPILKLAVQTPPQPHAAGTGIEDDHEARLAQLVGTTGEVACDLRPAGWMELGGERFDVVSEGAFIPKGASVRVIEVRGNRVVVERIEQSSTGSGETGEATIGFLISVVLVGTGDISFLIMLVLVGLALVVAEIFFVSFGILAIMSGVSLVTAVFLAFANHGNFVGSLFLTVCAIGVPLAVKYAFKMLPHMPFGKQLYLEGHKLEEVTGGAQESGLETLVGKTGVASCDLRPAGFAEIDGRRVDVITRGEMLEKNSPLRVIRVDTNQVIVALDLPSA